MRKYLALALLGLLSLTTAFAIMGCGDKQLPSTAPTVNPPDNPPSLDCDTLWTPMPMDDVTVSDRYHTAVLVIPFYAEEKGVYWADAQIRYYKPGSAVLSIYLQNIDTEQRYPLRENPNSNYIRQPEVFDNEHPYKVRISTGKIPAGTYLLVVEYVGGQKCEIQICGDLHQGLLHCVPSNQVQIQKQ